MGDDGRTRRIVLSVCAVAALALLLVLGLIATADWAPGDDDGRATRVADESERVNDGTRTPPLVRSVDASERGGADRPAAPAGLRGDPARFFTADAYPPDAIRAGEQGRTVARLTVDPLGIPRACAINSSSGSRSLDAATCAIAIGKVRFTPARDATGRPIASYMTLPVRWVLPQ